MQHILKTKKLRTVTISGTNNPIMAMEKAAASQLEITSNTCMVCIVSYTSIV